MHPWLFPVGVGAHKTGPIVQYAHHRGDMLSSPFTLSKQYPQNLFLMREANVLLNSAWQVCLTSAIERELQKHPEWTRQQAMKKAIKYNVSADTAGTPKWHDHNLLKEEKQHTYTQSYALKVFGPTPKDLPVRCLHPIHLPASMRFRPRSNLRRARSVLECLRCGGCHILSWRRS